MPGIVGLITKMPRERATAELQRMLRAMQHEQFYRTATWVDEKLGIYAGVVHREGADQPLVPQHSEDGRVSLLFSGDEFPDPGMRDELSQRGHVVARGPLAHLVHVAEESAEFPVSLNGQFQGLLADQRTGNVTLFNDRYGLRRVYWHQTPEAFYFAAEAKAILAVRPELRRLDPRAVGEFLACGCVLENRSLFAGIETLPFGSAWRFHDANLVSKGTYFSPEAWEQQEEMPGQEYYESVREVFTRNLPRYFKTQESVGLSLTGGLDTRMILAWHRPEAQSLPCYTFCSNYRETRDVSIARRVAEICGQAHTPVGVGSEFLNRFAEYAERTVFLTDGCSGVRHAADLYVNEAARQIAPVRMTGNYGDQVLRQMIVMRCASLPSRIYTPEVIGHAEAAREFYAGMREIHPLTLATTYQTAFHYYGLLALENTQVNVRTPYLDNDLVRVLYRAPASTLHNNEVRVRLIEDGSPVLRKIRTDLGFAGRGGPVLSQMSQQLHLFTMRLEYAFENGSPRWLSRMDRGMLGRQLERSFVGRHKFTHLCLWYRNELAGYLREMLLDPRTQKRDFVNGAVLEKMLNEHLTGTENHTSDLTRILTLEHLHRSLIDV